MKKILMLLAAVSIFPTSLWAHTQLRDASTLTRGTLDPARVSPTTFTMRGSQWSFDLDASTTLLRSLIGVVAVDSTTLRSMITDLSAATQTLNVILSTTGGFARDLSVSTQSLKVMISTTGSFGQDLSVSSQNLKVMISTTGSYGKDLSASTDTLRADITALSGASAPAPRLQLLTVGTSTAKSPNCVVTGAESFDAMYATVGVRGLLQNSTVTANIFFQEGIYSNLTGSVIPRNTSIYGNKGSSVVWTPTNTNSPFLIIHGSLDNVIIDLQGRAFTADIIRVSSGAYIGPGVKVINGQNFDQTTTVTLFAAKNSTGAQVYAEVDGGAAPCVQDNACGGLATANNAQDIIFGLKTKNLPGGLTTGKQWYYTQFSTGVVFGGYQENLGERPIVNFGGTTRFEVTGTWRITRGLGTGVYFNRDLQAPISTGVWVHDWNVYYEASNSVPNIQIQLDASIIGPLVTNCTFINRIGVSGPTAFINIPATVFGTVVANTHAYGAAAFATNSGAGSLITNMGNSLNNIAQ